MIAAAATGGGTVFAAGTTMAEITTDKTHDTLSGTEEQIEEEADTSTQVEDRQEKQIKMRSWLRSRKRIRMAGKKSWVM